MFGETRKTLWTPYRRHFVRELLARGESRAVIAERLGLNRAQLRNGILKYDLDQPEEAARG